MVNHYRWDFIGLSTDVKPTYDTSEKVTDGSTFYCSDTSKLYVWCKDNWYEKTVSGGGEPYVLPIAGAETLGGIKVGDNLSINAETGVLDATDTTYTAGTGISISAENVISATGGSGGITELTTTDYNYPTTGDKTEIALWLLPQGVYKIADNTKYRWSASTNDYYNIGGATIVVSEDKTGSSSQQGKGVLIVGKDKYPLIVFTNLTGTKRSISASSYSNNDTIMSFETLKTALPDYTTQDDKTVPSIGMFRTLEARVSALEG